MGRSFALRRAALAAVAFAAMASSAVAQSALTDLCPNAAEALGSVTYPLDMPPSVAGGEAMVSFTIGVDGSVIDIESQSSSEPAFAPLAVAAVRKLSCNARETPKRYRVPVSFVRPDGLNPALCPNMDKVMRSTSLVRNLRPGDPASALFEFTVQPDGKVTNVVALQSSDEQFSVDGARVLKGLNCIRGEAPRRVRTRIDVHAD